MPRTGPANLEIPRYTAVAKDEESTFLDYENPILATIQMKGAATFTEGGGAEARTLSDPAVFVSAATLESLATAAGFPVEATNWGISVSLKDMATSENVAALLRREFRDFTVLPASQLTAAAVSRSAISAGVPMDMRRITEGIAFVTAALLSATNLTVLMLSRKNEIGILRALGATRLNIATMVLTESVWISLLGAVLGGLLTQPAIIWQLLSNKVGSDVMLAEVGSGLGKAVAFAAVSAALFGFLPVAKALRVTPAQVLRGE
jgi:predicted lysophospholipase L1 biosynthesis ABC-type transport system permease subunit